MAAVIGQLPEFNPDSELLTTYVERVKLFIEANGIEEAQKVAVLLSVMGGKLRTLAESVVAYGSENEVVRQTCREVVGTLRTQATDNP